MTSRWLIPLQKYYMTKILKMMNVTSNISLNLVIHEFEPCNISIIFDTMFEIALSSFFFQMSCCNLYMWSIVRLRMQGDSVCMTWDWDDKKGKVVRLYKRTFLLTTFRLEDILD